MMAKGKLTGLAVLIALSSCLAQAPYFRNHYLLHKNQPVNVTTAFQDSRGFMWFGTDQGLFRYDGFGFVRFAVADSLPDRSVTAIAEDSLGRIWLGHGNGAISYIELGYVRRFEPAEGTPSATISDILFDRSGNLWFSTLDDGLYYYLMNPQRLYRIDTEEGMPDLYIYDIALGPDSTVWAGTDGGVAICRLAGRDVTIEVLDRDRGLPDNIVKRIVPGKGNTMWLAMEDAGIVGYDGKKWTPLLEEWDAGSVTDFIVDGATAWVATRQNGLFMARVGTGDVEAYGTGDPEGTGVINTILQDREGNIWIGTRSHIIMTGGDELQFISNLGPDAGSNVVALAQDRGGDLWFATAEGLFLRHLNKDGTAVVKRQLLGTPYRNFPVISLFMDEEGFIWAGLYGEGVLRIDPGSGKVRYFFKELRNGNVLYITGRGNTIWLATLGGCTRIVKTNEVDGIFEIKNYSSNDGLVSDFTYQVFVDSKDRLWFGTDGKGAVMMDDRGFHHYNNGLNSKVVYGFAEDADGRLYANVQGEGLYLLKGDRFAPLSVNLRDNNINCLAADTSGSVVVMHELGVDIYDTRKHRVKYLGEEAGLHDQAGNLNAVAVTEGGRIYLGTDKGIIRVHPSLSGRVQDKPRPYIAALRVMNKKQDLKTGLKLPYYRNNITFDYVAFWFQGPQNLQFEYKLENYDPDWISTRNLSSTYSSLPSGVYVFHVKASDTDDFGQAEETLFAFEILPPIWRTTGFMFFMAALITTLGYLYIRYREGKLLQDKRTLESEVARRTQEIQRQSEEIHAQSQAIQAQADEIRRINENLEQMVQDRTRELERKNKALEEYAFINAHQLRAPVASILGLIHLTERIELKQEEKQILSHLHAATKRLEEVVSDITRAIERGEYPT